jgi:hypothetical protein
MADFSPAGTILTAAGIATSVIGGIITADQQKRTATINAATIAQTSELNAELIEQGSELNAQVHDFNAAALELQATDAIAQGKQQETIFRQQLKQTIGSQRASFAAQGIDVSSGSAEDVQESTAYQGELDALQIRTNAAREAWGYTVTAQGETLQAQNTRKLGALQAQNTRLVGQAGANNARMGGNFAASATQWGVASTIATGSFSLAKQMGFTN